MSSSNLNKKKGIVISIFISLFGLISGLVLVREEQQYRGYAQAPTQPVLYFIPAEITVPANTDNLLYDIYLDTAGYEVNGLVYEVNFDPTYIEITNILEGDVLYQIVAHSVSGGTAYLEVKSAEDKPFVGAGIVAKVQFRTKDRTTPPDQPQEFIFGSNSQIHTKTTSGGLPADTPPGYVHIEPLAGPTPTPLPTGEPTPTDTVNPISCLQSTIPPETGPAPLTVFLHGGASASWGGILGYQWDFQNDGTWDTDVLIDPVYFTYFQSGTYQPKYRAQHTSGVFSETCDYLYDVVVESPVIPTDTPVPPTPTPTPHSINLSLVPAEEIAQAGNSVPISVYMNSSTDSVSEINLLLSHTPDFTSPDITISNISVDPYFTGSSDWSCSVQNTYSQGSTLIFGVSCNLSTTNYLTPTDTKLFTFDLFSNQITYSNPVEIVFNASGSIKDTQGNNFAVSGIPGQYYFCGTDFNNDGKSDQRDYAAWSYYFSPFGRVSGGPSVGDFNCDGYVDGRDYSLWSYNYYPY